MKGKGRPGKLGAGIRQPVVWGPGPGGFIPEAIDMESLAHSSHWTLLVSSCLSFPDLSQARDLCTRTWGVRLLHKQRYLRSLGSQAWVLTNVAARSAVPAWSRYSALE